MILLQRIKELFDIKDIEIEIADELMEEPSYPTKNPYGGIYAKNQKSPKRDRDYILDEDYVYRIKNIKTTKARKHELDPWVNERLNPYNKSWKSKTKSKRQWEKKLHIDTLNQKQYPRSRYYEPTSEIAERILGDIQYQ